MSELIAMFVHLLLWLASLCVLAWAAFNIDGAMLVKGMELAALATLVDLGIHINDSLNSLRSSRAAVEERD